MYKKISFEDACALSTQFFSRLKKIYTRERYADLNQFVRNAFKLGSDVYYFDRSEPSFRISYKDGLYSFIDERERLQITLSKEEMVPMNQFLKSDKKHKKVADNKAVDDQLFEDYMNGDFQTINGKPYLVYDIETTGSSMDLKNQKFTMAYAFISGQRKDNESFGSQFKYIDQENLEKFIGFMLDFDGYIVGFNNIYFDNPVCIRNSFGDPEMIKKLNNKSIDLFVLVNNITGRRYNLNKVSSSLVGIKKTLASGEEGMKLRKEYEATGDQTLLKKVKEYCKNDVKMTLAVFLYMYKNLRLYDEHGEVFFTEQDIIDRSQVVEKSEKNELVKTEQKVDSLF